MGGGGVVVALEVCEPLCLRDDGGACSSMCFIRCVGVQRSVALSMA
jgi:hypothetical protein